MRTKMLTKLDTIEARVVALESSLQNQESTLQSHKTWFRCQDLMLKEHTAMMAKHSSQLSSLMTSVIDLSRSFAMFHSEVREGLQLLHRHDHGKERIESKREHSLSFVWQRQNTKYRLTQRNFEPTPRRSVIGSKGDQVIIFQGRRSIQLVFQGRGILCNSRNSS